MLTIQRSVKIQVFFDAEYGDLIQHEDSNQAAHELNWELEGAVNLGLEREEVYDRVFSVMKKWNHCGATDSEPVRVLEKQLDKIFGVK